MFTPLDETRRRSVVAELSIEPMVDLFIIIIVYVMLTATWSHTGIFRAKAPRLGPSGCGVIKYPSKSLWVKLNENRTVELYWVPISTSFSWNTLSQSKQGATEVSSIESVTDQQLVRKEIIKQWEQTGLLSAEGAEVNSHAHLQLPNNATYEEMVTLLDALYTPKVVINNRVHLAFDVTID